MIFQAYLHYLMLEELYDQQAQVTFFIIDFDISWCLDYSHIHRHICELVAPYADIYSMCETDTTYMDAEAWHPATRIEELQTLVLDQTPTQLNNLQSIYHYSVPTVKLFYPEPFIAAASFMHSDLWFIHILVYQYWLWFVFIFIIVFFIITFLCIVRWCNMRVRPRRETRGVSRSKCGDLITAIVPVSWAASIIISESTDAIDYFDGFGTTEMVVGIRAYQWGWEYYYPKDIDLNYNVVKSHSAFFGRSLKYNRTSETNLSANKAWKFYQNKPYDLVVTPAHLLLLPTDNYKILNYLNFSDVGTNAFHDSALFKHTRMFSKTWNYNLVYSPTEFNLKFKQLAPLFITDFDAHDSASYGLKRQQNYLNTKALTNNFSTLFSLKNVSKLFSLNYNLTLSFSDTFKGKHQINFFRPNLSTNRTSTWLLNQLHSTLKLDNVIFTFTKKFVYSSILDKLNNDNDKKKLRKSLKKLLSIRHKKLNLLEVSSFESKPTFTNNLTSPSTFTDRFFSNVRQTQKFFISFSANQFVKKPGQTPKEYINLSARRGSPNLSSGLNAPHFYLIKTQNTLTFSPIVTRAAKKLKSTEPQTLYKLLTNRLYFDAPTPAFISNKQNNTLLNFDKYLPAEEENSFVSFQSREDLSPEYIYKAYWNLQGAQTDLTWRVKNSLNFNKLHNSFYLPFFTFGQDYDFLNWQGLIYLEDAYWENLCSVYALDDYLVFFDLFDDYTLLEKLERPFLRKDRIDVPELYIMTDPYFEDLSTISLTYSPSIYSEETFVDPTLMTTWQFSTFPTATNNFLAEESFDYFKALKQTYFNSFVFDFGYLNNNTPLISNIFAVDNFRSNTEDFFWYESSKQESSSLVDLNSLPLASDHFLFFNWNLETFGTFLSEVVYNHDLFMQTRDLNLDYDFMLNNNFNSYFEGFDFQKTLRFLSKMELRMPTRSALGMYNSYQKVYKPRLEENRSHAKTTDALNLASKQPNLTAPKPKLERSLGKNKASFLQSSTFKNELPLSFNALYDAFNSLNYYFFDFPFLMGLKSDPSRYYWTDWFARWGMFEVQPSSASRYSLSGVPFFNKSFDFSSDVNGILNDTETYFTRVARVRKNYLPTWTHAPYYYSKNTMFAANNFFFDAYLLRRKSLIPLKNLLSLSHWYWNSVDIDSPTTELFIPVHNNTHTYGRGSWSSKSLITTYYTTVCLLLDSLTKREHLYRTFLSTKKKIYRLENYMSNNPTSPLLNDIKTVFFLTNPTTFSMEYSRELYYSSLEFFSTKHIKPNLLETFRSLGIPTALMEKILDLHLSKPLKVNSTSNEAMKSQYKPMRRGILNMIRLHGTGAVAMPIEIRLQVLASSKDVIHSWAIPSAGVKIDCVPGYSSHRVIIFLVSGIFWGQCMEVCGRYHHWMPVIVYFMKRDLFFLWCTHFVFLSGSNNMWVINDRQHTNYGRTVSFSKNSWINELK